MLPRLAGIMRLVGHIVDVDVLACASSTICLLENALATTFFVEATDESKEEGCFLYFDRPRCIWIRSEKVTGRTLPVRHKEHHKSSKLQMTKDYE